MSVNGKVKQLVSFLSSLGLDGEGHKSVLFYNITEGKVAYTMQQTITKPDGKLAYKIFMATDKHVGGHHIDSFHVRWIPDRLLPMGVMNGVDLDILAIVLDKIKWTTDQQMDLKHFYEKKQTRGTTVSSVLGELEQLATGPDSRGEGVYRQLMYTYMQGSGIEWFINHHQLLSGFEISRTYMGIDGLPAVDLVHAELKKDFERSQVVRLMMPHKKKHVSQNINNHRYWLR